MRLARLVEMGTHIFSAQRGLSVEELMTDQFAEMRVSDPLDRVRRVLHFAEVDCILALNESENLVGIITRSDLPDVNELLTRDSVLLDIQHTLGANFEEMEAFITAADIMTPHVWAAHPNWPASRAAGLMQAHAIGRLPVLVGGVVVGLIQEARLRRVTIPEPPHTGTISWGTWRNGAALPKFSPAETLSDLADEVEALLTAWRFSTPVEADVATAVTLGNSIHWSMTGLFEGVVEGYATVVGVRELEDLRPSYRDAIAATALFRSRVSSDQIPCRDVFETAAVLLDELRRIALAIHPYLPSRSSKRRIRV